MKSNKKIKEQLVNLNTLQEISKMYAEIASSRMKRSRESVLTSRNFLEKVREVFNQVHSAYLKHPSKKITFIAHNGKNVIVFLSSNTGLYGDITKKTMNRFLEDVNKTGDDVVIIGRFGLSLFLGEMPDHPYTFFELSDNKIDEADFSKLVRHLVEYEEIRVHYPKFESVITQTPSEFKIAAGTPVKELSVFRPEAVLEFIFEPSIEELLGFFEKQMFTSLMEQTIRESQLAKFAARILAMDRAFDNISDKLSDSQRHYLSSVHRLSNKKQLENLTSVITVRS